MNPQHFSAVNELLAAQRRVNELLAEVSAIRDLTYRAHGDGMRDALEEIHRRASRLVGGA